MVTQFIRVLHKLELSPRATKLTRCVSNLRTIIIIHPEVSLVLPVLACTNRLEVCIHNELGKLTKFCHVSLCTVYILAMQILHSYVRNLTLPHT